MDLSHIDGRGKAQMVDVSAKETLHRRALAKGMVYCAPPTLDKIRENQIKKGDVLSTARIAGILGAKRCSELIPLCHNIFIDQITLEFSLEEEGVAIEATGVCRGRTGIEMEVLTAVTLAALTIYDMCKAVDKGMVIGSISLMKKQKEAL